MARFLLLATSLEMKQNAHTVLQEIGRTDVAVYLVPTADTQIVASLIESTQAQIIITRGGVARKVKRAFPLPVAEMVVTAQEMGLLITHAKQILTTDVPTIAVVGFSKMFCDMRDFDQIFGIRLLTYFSESMDNLYALVHQAKEDGAELVIGGEVVGRYAEELCIPHMMQPSGKDSIQQALRVADSIAWTLDAEKKNASELNTLLDFSSNGIIKINNDRCIMIMNHRAESFLNTTLQEVTGVPITQLLPALDKSEIWTEVFTHGHEVFRTFGHVNGKAVSVSIAPILVGDIVENAIVSCHELQQLSHLEAEARKGFYQNAAIEQSANLLEQFICESSAAYQTLINYSQYDDVCILLHGAHYFERSWIAQHVHTIGLRSAAPFISVSCAAYPPEAQLSALFGGAGRPCPIAAAENGTVFLDEIELLSPQAQFRLEYLLQNGLFLEVDAEPRAIDVRVLAGTAASLNERVQQGLFRSGLFYLLSTLRLDIPALEGCPIEIGNWFTYYIEKASRQYSRYLRITKSARSSIVTYPWHGGHAELAAFCRRAVISAPKHVLDEATVLRLLKEITPAAAQQSGPAASSVVSTEVARLKALLEKYDGNRQLIAEEMHISVTTLWRRMKKYNLR